MGGSEGTRLLVLGGLLILRLEGLRLARLLRSENRWWMEMGDWVVAWGRLGFDGFRFGTGDTSYY